MLWRKRKPDGLQRELPFLTRSRRLDRLFKRIIIATTFLFIFGAVFGTRVGRNLSFRMVYESKRAVAKILGFADDRSAYEAQRDRERVRGIDQAREALGNVAAKNPKFAELLGVAKLDRDSAIVRWGNFDWTLALSSAVFENDDAGRSYKLLPNTRSVWLINLTVDKVSAMFEIPDTPEARRLGEGVGGRVVPESVQTTNSWGCRGPEPDPKAELRGIVLGDSNMQGLLVGDDQTPPVRLEAALKSDLGVSVSVLNTGVLGYSPEQYYYSLMAFHERFPPDFVVVSICNNDFGDLNNLANWAEGEYWLDAIAQFCRTRGIICLVVPVPQEDAMTGRRNETVFPAQVSKIFDGSGQQYINPIEEFTTEHLTLKARALRDAKPFPNSPLFNRRYGDNHMSPLGCDLWAKLVARRIRLIGEIQTVRPSWLKSDKG